mgnify:CR=1 FL=1
MEQRQTNSAALGWCMVALQFFFAISWTAYVLYLPKLLQQAGAPRAWLLPLLMADQVVFAISDLLVGVQADKVRASMRRFGHAIAIAATLSCAAFLALPFVAPAFGAPALLVCIFVWAVASAALRVPEISSAGVMPRRVRTQFAVPLSARTTGLVRAVNHSRTGTT